MSLHEAMITRDIGKARRLIRRRVGIDALENGETPLMLQSCVPATNI